MGEGVLEGGEDEERGGDKGIRNLFPSIFRSILPCAYVRVSEYVCVSVCTSVLFVRVCLSVFLFIHAFDTLVLQLVHRTLAAMLGALAAIAVLSAINQVST